MQVQSPKNEQCSLNKQVKLAISSCLLGQEVRFDGGHKRNVFVQEALSQVAEFVPLCPEVAIGMGIPRESIRLVEDDDGELKLLGTRSKQEWTAPMQRYAHEIAQWLEEQDICGFIFTKNSPSCGLFRVKIYNPKGSPSRRDGRGLFSEIITQHHPLLPVEEGGRLNDPALRDLFLTRVFAYKRAQSLLDMDSVSSLVQFHANEKLLLLAYNEPVLRELGRIVASAKQRPLQQVTKAYRELFLSAFNEVASLKRHANVLLRTIGHLKKITTAEEVASLHEAVEGYRARKLPRSVPLSFIRHFGKMNDNEYIKQQTYLSPYPKELVELGWS